MSKDIDVICLGRIAVDLYAEQYGCELEYAGTFKKYVGGSAGNIAIGASRLGLKTSMLSCVGNDAMGQYIINTLQEEAVDISCLKQLDNNLTGLVLLGVCPPEHFPLIFYRQDCADMQINSAQLDSKLFESSKSLLLTGTGLSTEHMFDISLKSINLAKRNNTKVVLDIDYRPVLWGLTSLGNGEDRYIKSSIVSEKIQKIIADIDLLVGTEEELCIAGGSSNLDEALATVKKLSNATIVIKRGEKGCSIIDKSLNNILDVHSPDVDVLNVLGAGDAFLSGFLLGYLNSKSIIDSARLACVCGAIVVTRHACSASMPKLAELKGLYTKTYGEFDYNNFIKKSKINNGEQYYNILAFDHRKQFEDAITDYYGEDGKQYSNKITEFKNIIYSAVLKIEQDKDKNPVNSHSLGIIADPVYSKKILNNFRDKNTNIKLWLPIERAGDKSLNWLDSDKSVYQQLANRPKHFGVKVLFNYNNNWPLENKKCELDKLKELYYCCKEQGKELLLELILPDTQSSDSNQLITAMQDIYICNIKPSIWKIQPLDCVDKWQGLDEYLDKIDKEVKVIILGGNNKYEQITSILKCASASNRVCGYAIGRAVFWDVWQEYLSDDLPAESAINIITERYTKIISLWQELKDSK